MVLYSEDNVFEFRKSSKFSKECSTQEAILIMKELRIKNGKNKIKKKYQTHLSTFEIKRKNYIN
jgi:hypothetical protein